MKKHSPDLFKLAMKKFNDANSRLADEFFIESLSLQDRVMAAKLRVQSGLLLSFENPAVAITCKKVYLKDLHKLPAMVKIFRNDLEGGLFSGFNKTERHELVQSVSMINLVLFQFLACFTKQLMNVYNWPLIGNDDWMYNPLIPDEAILRELLHAEIKMPNLLQFEAIQSEMTGIDPTLVAIDSHGDLIFFRQRSDPDACELLKVSGNNVAVFHTFKEFTVVSFLAIDATDDVYVFADRAEGNVPVGYTMYDVFVFDKVGYSKWTYKNVSLLDGSIVLAPTPQDYDAALCIPNQIMIKEPKVQGQMESKPENKIQGGVDDGQSEEKIQEGMKLREGRPGELNTLDSISIEIKMSRSTLATITNRFEVVAIEKLGFHVCVFERDGRVARRFELHEGEREACVGITFNSITRELIVVSRIDNCYFLSAYSTENWKRCHQVRLAYIAKECQEIAVTSHCRGSIAVVTKDHVLFVQ